MFIDSCQVIFKFFFYILPLSVLIIFNILFLTYRIELSVWIFARKEFSFSHNDFKNLVCVYDIIHTSAFLCF